MTGKQTFGTAVALLIAAATVGCDQPGPPPSPEVPVHHVESAETVVSTESGLIAAGSGIHVDASGAVWISDRIDHRVLSVDPEGEELVSWGREGEGPGELQRPEGVAVSDNEVIVLDFQNRRVQAFGLDGEYLRSVPVPTQPALPASLNRRGEVAFSVGGRDGSLIGFLNVEDGEVILMGEARASPPTAISQIAIDEQVERREIPVEFQNHVLPVVGDDGSIWVVVQSEGTVKRYGRDGEILWSTPLPEGDVRQAHETFFRRWEAEGLRGFPVPWTVSAGTAHEGELFLLLQTDEGGRSVLLRVEGETGVIESRIMLPVPPPAGPMAIDGARGWLYLLVPDDARLIRMRLP